MSTSLDVRLVAHYRGLLAERLVALAIYGSRARGDFHEYSDLDLLLIARALPQDAFERVAVLPGPRLSPDEPSLSLRALTPAEYERDIAPLDLDIAVDARILYERDHYLSERLALIRQRIAEAGLVRHADLSWHWRRAPTRRDWAVTWEGVRL